MSTDRLIPCVLQTPQQRVISTLLEITIEQERLHGEQERLHGELADFHGQAALYHTERARLIRARRAQLERLIQPGRDL